ncbi:unnamed protein product, partial [Prorocentrum cordatum]
GHLSAAPDPSASSWCWALGFLQGFAAGVSVAGIFIVREADLPASAASGFEQAAAEQAQLARRRALTGREIWHERLVILGAYIMTPDLDVYPEDQFLSRDVEGIKPLAGQGAVVDGVGAGSVYRFRRVPSAQEVWDAVREAVAVGAGALPQEDFGMHLGEGSVLGMAPGLLFLRDPQAAASPPRGGPLVPAAPPALGGEPPPHGPPDPLGDALASALRPGALPGAAVGGTATPPAPDAPGADPRVLVVTRDTRGRRDRSFGDALKEQTELEREDWPVLGPRALLWVLTLMLRMAGGAVAWHTRWLAVVGIAESEEAAKQHETICRILETSMVCDQLVITELASFEYLARQLQLIEERVYDEKTRKTAAALKGQGKKEAPCQDALSTEVGHFLGIGETKGNLCICPALMQFIAEQMRNEAAVPLASASGMLCRYLCWMSTRGCTPWQGVGLVSSAARGAAWRRWCNEGIEAFNWLHGRADRLPLARGSADHSLAQHVAVEELQENYRSFELPAGYSEQRQFCEASLAEVLSTTPGCQNSSRVRPYDKALVAWPALSGPPVEAGSVAQQADAIQLQGWRQSMLRSEDEIAELQ